MINLIKKISKVLDKKNRVNLAILILFSCLAGLMEMIGVSLIIPIVAIFSKNEFPEFLSYFKDFNLLKDINFLFFSLIIINITKNVFLIFFTWQKNKFLNSLQINLSQRMFENYISKKYEFHIQNNSAVLHRNVYDDSIRFQSTIQSLVGICLDLFILSALLIILLLTKTSYTIIILFFFLFTYLSINFLVDRVSLKWGNLRHFYHGKMIQHLIQGFSSIKEIKFLKSEKKFLNEYKFNQIKNARYDLFYKFTLNTPRYALEIIFLIFIGFIFFYFSNYLKVDNYEYIAIFIYCALKIFPIINRLVLHSGNIKYNLVSVLSISEELTQKNNNNLRINFKEKQNIIEFKKLNLKNVSFKYSSSEEFIFNNFNLELKSNMAILITGKSGSGKSTLIDLILGLLKPQKGSICLNDIYELEEFEAQWHKLVSYIPQYPIFIDDNIKSNVALGSKDEEIDEKKIIECLKLAKIYDHISNLNSFLDSNIGEKGVKLSGGQKQRLAIARALYKDPTILIFDETTNSIDQITERSIIKDIINLKKK